MWHPGLLTAMRGCSLWIWQPLPQGGLELKGDRMISLGSLPQKAQGRNCPTPRGFPPGPGLGISLGTTQTRQAAFYLADWAPWESAGLEEAQVN